MTAVNPSVNFYKKVNPVNNNPGMAGKIAYIGAFDTEETNPQLFVQLDDAYDKLGTDKETYKGVACLEGLFYGASSVLAVNYTSKKTTGTGENEQTTIETDLTTKKLSDSLAKIKGEDWDILFIAEDLSNDVFPILIPYLDECFKMKCAGGYVGGITRNTADEYVETLGMAGDQCYGIVCGQKFGLDGEAPISVLESAAYMAGVIASQKVGNSMTMKQIPRVTSVSPELSFENGGDGLKILEAGGITVKCQDRTNSHYVWVNSEQPNGYDLYINRVRDYVVKEMSLHKFLGDRNRKPTLNEIEHELSHTKDKCVTVLDLLKDIEYSVEKTDANCADINITKLLFDGVLTTINVYMTVEVE